MSQSPHIFQVFPTFAPGGAQVRFTRLANAFGPNLSYTILAMDGNFEAAKLLDRDVTVSLIKPDTRTFPWSARFLQKLILQLRPQLVVTNNWGSIDAVLAAWVARICPVIHSEDGFGADEAAGLKQRRVAFRRLVLNRIHTTVVPSRTLLRIAHDRYRLDGERVTFIPNGIDIRKYPSTRGSEVRQTFGVARGNFVVGYVGHLRAEKALDVLINAFAQANIPDARLILVGDGPCRPGLSHLAQSLGVAGQVHFAGHISDPAPYLSAFDLLAMSSATEQMPLAILEAMASGLPVIATDVGDCAEMLGSGKPPVIVPPNDVPAYAKALKLLAESPELRRRLASQNRKRCVELYSFETMLEAYRALYERALGVPFLQTQRDAASRT